MAQILEQQVYLWGGQLCLADREAELPHDVTSANVLVSPNAIVLRVDEWVDEVATVQVFLGSDDDLQLSDLMELYAGPITLGSPGLLLFSPTGDEVLLQEVQEGSHEVRLYRSSGPSSRLVVLLDPDITSVTPSECASD